MTDGATSATRPASPGVDRALTVLEHLVESDEELTLTALAKATRIPLATCASIVYTLEQRGYAARRIVGRSHFWRPTLRLYGLASQLIRKVDLSQVAPREMRELADRLGMPVHMGVLDGPSVVYVAKAATPGFVQFDTYSGKIAPFNLTALGRAIAAYLDPDELEPLLSKLAPGRGPNAPKGGRKAFLALLESVREGGHALEDEEEQAEISCIAVPFFGADGHVAGSVGVTGFARDLTEERKREAIVGLSNLALTVSRRLDYPKESLPSALALS